MDVDDGVNGPPRSVDPAVELKHLANAIYRARLEGGTTSDNATSSNTSSSTSPILQSALQHFALTRSHLRKQALSSKRDKARVAETRQRLDTTFLALQNRKYEINHLLREIEKCNDYEWVACRASRGREHAPKSSDIYLATPHAAPSTRTSH